MHTINSNFSSELTINKSLFIGQLFPIKSSEEAFEILKNIRKKYYDANHNCYAFITNSLEKYSDDKEPSQTAGIVILDVLKKNNLNNILCIVTRYFGGIKLGSGGLIRAYSQATAKVIKESTLIEIIKYCIINITISYSNFNLISKFLDEYIIEKDFQENVHLKIKIPENKKEEITKHLLEVTKNQILFSSCLFTKKSV